MPCKHGNHTAFRMHIKNEQLFRYYTVVPHYFVDKSVCEDTNRFYFIIKIYKNGEFTSKLNELKIGNQIEMSDVFSIDFDIRKILANKQTIYLLAAGTGLTPMLSVLCLSKSLKSKSSNKQLINLVFCNKTEEDIILKDQFDRLTKEDASFNFINILSRPASSWSGLKGRISKNILKEQLHEFDDQSKFLFLCGPDEFNLSVLNSLDALYQLKENSYFVFSS